VDSRETLEASGHRFNSLRRQNLHERGARRVAASSNFGVKLSRLNAGPAAELPTSSLASRRHAGRGRAVQCDRNPQGGANPMRYSATRNVDARSASKYSISV
jgi:hypothetical protein